MILIARKRLHPTSEKLSGSFMDNVARLSRPYITITHKQFNKLIAGAADIYVDNNGNKFTFGTTSDGYALMPIDKK